MAKPAASKPLSPDQVPPGYRQDAKGRLVHESQIDAADLQRDELVRSLFARAEQLHEDLAAFKHQALDDIEAHIALVAEKYEIQVGGKKGNVTLMTYDGSLRIQRNVADRLVFDERLQVAKELVDRCINKWSGGANENLKVLVQDAFQVERVINLTRVKIADPDWEQAVNAIRDSMQVLDTSTYVRFYRRRQDSDSYEALPLDISAL